MFNMKKVTDGQKGQKKITEALNSFAGLAADLEEGQDLVMAQQKENEEEIKRLETENMSLKTSGEQASNLATNLRSMVSGKMLVAPAELVAEE